MKKNITYLFIVFIFELMFISNSYSADMKFEKCKLYASEKDYYTSFELDFKNNDIYRTFYAKGDIYDKYIKITSNTEDEIFSSILNLYENNYVKYKFDKKTNDVIRYLYKDPDGKIRTERTKMICDNVEGRWEDEIIIADGSNNEKKWITKKKSKNKKEIEKIEKMYAEGYLSKSECVKAKSKLLKISKSSKTICDNVEVKLVKKETKSDLEKEVDNLSKQLEDSKKKKKKKTWKKKKKKEKKKKKDFQEKEKDLSKETKSWITKKKKEKKKSKLEERFYNSLAELPNSEFYFYAIDENDRNIFGYVNPDNSSKFIEVENRKFRKGSEGKAYITGTKISCDIYSEVDKAESARVYFGDFTMICLDKQQFIGNWSQVGTNGKGFASSKDGKNSFDFIFSADRELAIKVASKGQKEEEHKIDYNEDNTDPVIKTVNKIETNGISILEGVVEDDSGEVILIVDGNRINLDKNGNFKFPVNAKKQNSIILEAYDNSGNQASKEIPIILIAKKYTTNQNYHAIVIGINNYKHLEKLEVAENDARTLANILMDKYNFNVKLMTDSTRAEIVDGLYEISRNLTEKDNLLIYYAGHGSLDKEANEGYWLPIDAKPNSRSNWISNDFLIKEAKATKAKHVLLIADSCFAGSLMRTAGTDKATKKQMQNEIYLRKLEKKKSRQVMTSGGEEYVVDNVGGNHSLFAEKLIETLKTSNYVVNTDEIFTNIRKFVTVNVKQMPEKGILYETGHDGGDFLFFPIN